MIWVYIGTQSGFRAIHHLARYLANPKVSETFRVKNAKHKLESCEDLAVTKIR